MTNIDKIKSMNAEEMAAYFILTQKSLSGFEWGVDNDFPTEKAIKKWLESEAKNDRG